MYSRIIAISFAIVFILGGCSHFYLGQTAPEGYAAYANTALVPALEQLWHSFVMPNIRVLTILLGIFEITCGIGLLFSKTRHLATIAILGFFAFIFVLGYSWPSDSLAEDLLKNRAFTLVMMALILPLALPAAGARHNDDLNTHRRDLIQ